MATALLGAPVRAAPARRPARAEREGQFEAPLGGRAGVASSPRRAAPGAAPRAGDAHHPAALPSTGPSEEGSLPPESAAPGQRRPLPHYDGRPPARVSAAEVLVWIPRVLLFPVHAILEYAVRWPAVALLTLLEKHHVIEHAKRIFLFHERKGLIVPTILTDLGRFRSLGLYVRYRDLFRPGHTVQTRAGFWGTEWVEAELQDRFPVFAGGRGTVRSSVLFRWRPDGVFHGLGYDSRQEAESYFRVTEATAQLELRTALRDLSWLWTGLTYQSVKIEGGQRVSIDAPERAPYWDAPTLPGFGERYDLLTLRTRLQLDSRSPERERTPGSGVRLILSASYSLDPAAPSLQFASWGGELTLYGDLTGQNRVLALRIILEAQENTGRVPVPLYHRVALGGMDRLRGFSSGRYRGDSAFLLSAQYRYPIWWMLDASLFAEVGNVFTGRFEDFAYRRLAASAGFGLRTSNSRDVSFDLLIAIGTNRIERWRRDFAVSQVHLVVGINHGL